MSETPPEHPERLVVEDEPGPRRTGRPRLLLTNDDGIDSPGLRLLARHLARRHELVVVAPNADRSGSGTGIGRFDPDKGVSLGVAELDGIEAYTVDGPPGLAVLAGALGAFGRPPDLVVSGVNAGLNTGHSIVHSGTVGAVLTARTFGRLGVAVSLAPSEPWHWETAVAVAADVVDWILERGGARLVLNVNVPAAPLAELRGVTWAPLDDFGYFRVATADAPAERLEFEVAARDSGQDPSSDTALCLDRYVTLTPLSAVEAAPFPPVPAERVCAVASRG